jgi:FixJ family two-component response regulator
MKDMSPLKLANETALDPAPPMVAIVDDDPSVRRSTQRLLWSSGICASAFASADELLTSGALLDADCLLLDVRMPGMDGLTLQHNLAKTGIPVVFLSARATEEEERRALQANAAAFLRKPVSRDALLRAVIGALRNNNQKT